jgi:hypothetical protein
MILSQVYKLDLDAQAPANSTPWQALVVLEFIHLMHLGAVPALQGC